MDFELNEKILEFLTLKTNDFKKQQYIDLFNTFTLINQTPEFIYKFSPSDIELELLTILERQEELDDTLLELDGLLKAVILENLSDNGISLDSNIPQYLLVEFLETLVSLYHIEPSLTLPLLNILEQLGNTNNAYLLGQLLNEYSVSNAYEMVEYILELDVSLLHKLKIKYEEDHNSTDEEKEDLDVDSINLFIVKYDVSKIKENKLLKVIANHDLFNKKFEYIYPFLNEILSNVVSTEDYIQYLLVGYIASKEGYDNLLRNYKVLEEYSLLIDRENYKKQDMENKLVSLLQMVKRS